MPALEKKDLDERESDRDKDDKGSKQKASQSASAKSKDVSHVPCKFFKVGGCTAGSSCPFSHSVVEPGGQKDVCAWFVKGNCKFGHKCALAHVLPGQSMAMDRKNKKAAQIAANKEKEREGGATGKAGSNQRGASKRDGPSQAQKAVASSRPPIGIPLKASISPPAPNLATTNFASFSSLDEASTKLTNARPGAADGATLHEVAAVGSPPGQSMSAAAGSSGIPVSSPRSSTSPRGSNPPHDFGPIGSPPRGAISPTSPPRLNGLSTNAATSGTPSSPSSHTASVNTNSNFLSTSPFSAPGSQSIFRTTFVDSASRPGIAASLGATLTMGGAGRSLGDWGNGEFTSTSFSASSAAPFINGVDESVPGNGITVRRRRDPSIEDGELEELLPSSLTDLLTPEERFRRMSRTNSSQVGTPKDASVLGGAGSPSAHTLGIPLANAPGGTPSTSGHRYSRSVPAPSLLGDIASIWSNNPPNNATPAALATPHTPSSSNLTAGLPSSPPSSRPAFASGAHTPSSSKFDPLGEDTDFNIDSATASMLSPSNASAAFLLNMHQRFKDGTDQRPPPQVQGAARAPSGLALGRGARGASNPLMGSSSTAATIGNAPALGRTDQGPSGLPGYIPPSEGAPSAMQGQGQYGNKSNATAQLLSTYAGPPQIPASHIAAAAAAGSTSAVQLQMQQQQQQQNPSLGGFGPRTGVNPGSGVSGDGLEPHMLSPSSRALQSHAPGQSLPQGLAAGYSRIHALPPAPLQSPGTGSFAGSLGVGSLGVSASPGIPGSFVTGPFGGQPQPPLSAASIQQGAWVSNGSGLGVPNQQPAVPTWPPASTNSNTNRPTGTHQTHLSNPTLDSMFSKLSYSAAAKGTNTPNAAAPSTPGRWGAPTTPNSGASGPAHTSSLSPLGRPSASGGVGDDDDVFTFDG